MHICIFAYLYIYILTHPICGANLMHLSYPYQQHEVTAEYESPPGGETMVESSNVAP